MMGVKKMRQLTRNSSMRPPGKDTGVIGVFRQMEFVRAGTRRRVLAGQAMHGTAEGGNNAGIADNE